MRQKFAATLAGLALLTACHQGVEQPETIRVDTTRLAARGEYIVRNVAVCGHCHAKDRSDPDGPLSGGGEFRNWRLGTIRAANLTSDAETGLGTWSAGEIVQAVRVGLDREEHVLAPVMPYHWYNGMSDRDAAAVAWYLKRTRPVRNEVDSDPNVVFGVGTLFFIQPERERNVPEVPRGATAEYGKYLAMYVAACVDCHTPRGGPMSTTEMDKLFAGNAHPPEAFPANPSNITPDATTGIGRWSEEDFMRALRTGRTPDGRVLHPFMPWRQYSHMTDSDLRAIYRYLRTVRPIENEVPLRRE